MDPAQPMIDWINSAPPAELAAELMTAFGPDGPRGGDAVSSYEITEWMFRAYPKQTGIFLAARPVNASISEAVQLLEHSELIYLRWFSNDHPVWSVTRLGTASLAAGKEGGQAAHQGPHRAVVIHSRRFIHNVCSVRGASHMRSNTVAA